MDVPRVEENPKSISDLNNLELEPKELEVDVCWHALIEQMMTEDSEEARSSKGSMITAVMTSLDRVLEAGKEMMTWDGEMIDPGMVFINMMAGETTGGMMIEDNSGEEMNLSG